ncbi:superoxide dismutase family protein [Phenylobacterium deserti]|uniref:Superoxide dismutase [Cu-Zn] n=1 Tax=Phenylobacterium deserti TaxID=1914756 RepID=A0A328ATW2_9CAUL|nr:superoxide dismutase family protein [Phenylobacterium deserti]RAK58047.1 superoxide dismutase family protein [Phenylobacterium deserti]
MTIRALPLALAAALASSAALAQPATVKVELKNAAGASAGSATLTDAPKGVLIRVEARGLTPGWHGLHFHETGDCSKSDFTSAGGHTHGGGDRKHGLLNPDANETGDLPNLFAAADGSATGEFYSTLVSLKGAGGRQGLQDANGSALLIHASADDQTTQPIGGAGARVACGVIK